MNEAKIEAYVTLRDGVTHADILKALTKIAPLYSIMLRVQPNGSKD